ncbi:hypothetical protein Lal_00034022 [Lupinus albus]|nr:hypothetical protein Lal_00034022 [Lupinus albus]
MDKDKSTTVTLKTQVQASRGSTKAKELIFISLGDDLGVTSYYYTLIFLLLASGTTSTNDIVRIYREEKPKTMTSISKN